MKNIVVAFFWLVAVCLTTQGQTNNQSKAVFLEKISWVEAEKVLKPESVVVIVLGAQSKQHGPHMPLATDYIQAEYFKNRIAERMDVVIAPSINYSFYPPFIRYPGSTTLRLSVAREMLMDICRSLARFGARRFYVINIGNTTVGALGEAANLLKEEGILLRFSDLDKLTGPLRKEISKQEKGTHADEIETSKMLYIAPSLVNMKKAVKEYGVEGKPRALLPPTNYRSYWQSGVYGDATLATREKGKRLVEAFVEDVVKEIDDLKRAELPKAESLDEIQRNFLGQYEIAPNDVITITAESEFLAAERVEKPKASMLRSGKYKYGIGLAEAIFFPDASGKITHMVFSIGERDFLARKIK